ncbi:MAG: TIGR04222 domain-containing membrane protein [Nitrospirae bacterium]|nr:TIGR04222 domain-containing membrane protein [Nitrospirota bacterium]
MIRSGLIFLSLVSLVLLCSLNANGAIVVSDYEGQFTVVPNESGRLEDVAVTLMITYDTNNQTLSKGFKFVGTDRVNNVNVRDEHGNIALTVETLRETRISFAFNPVINGKKTVTITFLIAGAIKDGLFSSQFDAQWLGNWNIPVNRARYCFTLPDKYNHSDIKTNIPYRTDIDASGKERVIIEETPLKTRHLRLEVSPAINGSKRLSFFIAWAAASLCLVVISATRRLRLPQPRVMDTQQTTVAEVAYLKKGFKHAVCVSIFDLIQRGFLQQMTERGYIQHNTDNHEVKPILNAYEYGIVAFFRQPAKLRDFFANKGATKAFKKEVINALSRKGCLISGYDKQSLFSTVIFGSILICVVLVAMGNHLGINTTLIAWSLMVPVVCTIWAGIFLVSNVKSNIARKVLADLEETVRRDSLILTNDQQYSPFLGYAIAIIGMSILVGTVYDTLLDSVSYARAMNAGTSTACSSCGSSASSGDGGSSSGGCSSCSGGGGSSGCGGCGGGGD